MFTKTKGFLEKMVKIPIDKKIHLMSDDRKDIIWLLMDGKRRILAYSPTLHHYENINESLLIGKNMKDLVPKEVYDKIFLPEVTEQTDCSQIELILNEKRLIFEMKRRKVVTDKEQYYRIVLKDITYIKQLEQKVYENEKMLQSATFAMGMIHEFRNPLTSIRGFLQLLQAGVKQEAAYYNVMINEVDKLEQISNSLLQLSKPYESRKENKKIASMINDVIFLFQTQVNMKDVLFQLEIDEDMLCYCNATQIKQVLLNLIKNATEAIEYNGLIQIKAFKVAKGEQALIEIIDNGIGVSDEFIRDVARPFYTTKKDGTGLGLAISYDLLKEHDGSLTITNHENGGTVATILLPITMDHK